MIQMTSLHRIRLRPFNSTDFNLTTSLNEIKKMACLSFRSSFHEELVNLHRKVKILQESIPPRRSSDLISIVQFTGPYVGILFVYIIYNLEDL